MNKHPRWATHIVRWPDDGEKLYLGKNLYQYLETNYDGFNEEPTKMEGQALPWFLKHGWEIAEKLNMPMENK